MNDDEEPTALKPFLPFHYNRMYYIRRVPFLHRPAAALLLPGGTPAIQRTQVGRPPEQRVDSSATSVGRSIYTSTVSTVPWVGLHACLAPPSDR